MRQKLTQTDLPLIRKLLRQKKARPVAAGFQFQDDGSILSIELAQHLILLDAACLDQTGLLKPTARAREYVRRGIAEHEEVRCYAVSSLAAEKMAQNKSRNAPKSRAEEGPLDWLYNRTNAEGEPLILPYQFEAGDRLRSDFERGQMVSSITMNWSSVQTGRIRGGNNKGSIPLGDSALSARNRVRQALIATGPDFADLLLDVCCRLKGISDVEKERKWPPRSAKLVLKLALNSLARHYGLMTDGSDHGRPSSRIKPKTQSWMERGSKPVL